MGTLKKHTQIFGKSTGIHRKKRKEKHVGRPKLKIIRSRKPGILSLRIQKVKKATFCLNSRDHKKCMYVSRIVQHGNNMKLKIKKIEIQDLSSKGYRFINLDSLYNHVTEITMHVCQCPKAIEMSSKGLSPVKLKSVSQNLGLATILYAECQGCSLQFNFSTSPKLPNSNRFDINVRAVWGSLSTGNGPSHLNEMLSTMNSPGLSANSFSSIEEEIRDWWNAALQENMLQAGEEERRLAIQRGSFHHDVPAITVITDGGWSKRTHKHTYNAMGGVAIIIGKATGKLLYLGIRNKYCFICSKAEKSKVDAKPHRCFKNWDSDSQSMESDIIVKGFQEAEKIHGLRYMNIIGDGDSSVFARIKDEVELWGKDVKKEKCSNHTCKCYRSNLEKLVAENNLYKGKHHLTKSTRVRLVSALRSAIRMRSSEVKCGKLSKPQGVQQLRNDIKNSVYHVFGLHSQCSNFCKAKSSDTPVPDNNSSCSTHNDDSISSDVFTDQHDFWKEGSSDKALEEARGGTHVKFDDVEQYIIRDVSTLLQRIAERADRLIGNNTTNLAENWMSIRCKFDGGKMYNLCSRGSWNGRCYGGGLRMNFGPKWSPIVWESSTATKAGPFFNKFYERSHSKIASSRKYQSKPETHQSRWKRKMKGVKDSGRKKARRSYGPEATDVAPDIPTSELDQLKQEYLKTHILLPQDKNNNITKETLKQADSDLWISERKKRLTASNFGLIVRRNPSIPVTKLVRNLLYSKFKGNQHTRNGLLQERSTIEEYKLKKAEENINVTVVSSGLVIDKGNPFLAGSPDGIVHIGSDTGLIEIKNLMHSKPINLFQAAESTKSFCLKLEKGLLKLKETHPYYYQCQGLVNICNCEWIDFVVRTLNPYQLFIQRVNRDEEFWNTTMLPKLKAFYMTCILPELASPREGKLPGIREPGVWYSPPVCQKGKAIVQRQQTKKRKNQTKGRSSDDTEPETESQPPTQRSGRKRTRQVKFVGRRIGHEWVKDELKNERKWYNGTVLGILSGKDGVTGAVYEVQYDGEDEAYEVDHLLEDYNKSSVEFLDL